MNKKACLICGEEIDKKRTYCSRHCQIVAQHRNGCHTSPFKRKEIKEKIKKTIKEKYGVENVLQIKEYRDKSKTPEKIEQQKKHRKETMQKRYGVDYNSQIPSVKEKVSKKLHNAESNNKRIQAFQKKYGTDNYLCSNEFKKNREKWVEENKIKEYNTKKANNSFNTSKPEETIYILLCKKFHNVKRQHKTEFYPYMCDFYIEDINLYIEYQGHWTHGKEPYQENKKEHISLLENWKSKNNKFYNLAIDIWTRIDPQKRKIAKDNNLKWIEFFNIEDFNIWYNNITTGANNEKI